MDCDLVKSLSTIFTIIREGTIAERRADLVEAVACLFWLMSVFFRSQKVTPLESTRPLPNTLEECETVLRQELNFDIPSEHSKSFKIDSKSTPKSSTISPASDPKVGALEISPAIWAIILRVIELLISKYLK